jgi:NTE family protein
MADVINREFPATNFSDLKIPFAAIVCDLSTGEEVILSDGDLITAIRASCAIPGIFVPVEFEGKKLIDGGVVAPLPTAAARKLGADLVIAVDVIACGADYLGQPSTLIGTFIQSGMLMLRQSSRQQHNYADLVIQPPVSNFRPDEINRGEEMLEIGYKAAIEAIDSIQESIHRLAEEKQARQ